MAEDLQNIFNCKNNDFYKNGIYKFVSHWEKVIACEDGYFDE